MIVASVLLDGAIIAFAVAALVAGARLLAGPTLADRVIALDVVLISLMGAVATDAADRGRLTNLNLLVVIAIIGFTATVAASWFIEREESLPADRPSSPPDPAPRPEDRP